MRVVVDLTHCQGYTQCAFLAPSVVRMQVGDALLTRLWEESSSSWCSALGALRNVEWLRDSGLAAGTWGLACDSGRRAFDVNGLVTGDVFVAGDKSVGVPTLSDELVITQGSLAERRFIAVYGWKGRITAAVAFDQSKWLEFYEALIDAAARRVSERRAQHLTADRDGERVGEGVALLGSEWWDSVAMLALEAVFA
jgi:hypothetical protein